MVRFKIHVILLVMAFTSCTNEIEHIQTGIPEFMDGSIISITEAKTILAGNILKSSYARNTLERNPYLGAMDWGPVILVENTGVEDDYTYYYVFHGILPDNAIGYVQAMNAHNGKLLGGALTLYNEVQGAENRIRSFLG